jgi:hypothetical protein
MRPAEARNGAYFSLGETKVVHAYQQPGQAMENLQGWKTNLSTGWEHAAGERLVTWLQEQGHSDVQRFCVNHEVRMCL